MPIGLVVGALAFSLAGMALGRPILQQVARYCLILAFLFLFPTILFGIADWQYYYNGASLAPIRTKVILSGLLMVFLIGGVWFNRKGPARSRTIMPIYVLSFLTVVALGYHGGELVLGGRSPAVTQEFRPAGSIFEAHCTMCHPGGGNVTNPKLPLRNAPPLASLEAFIRHLRDPRLSDGSPGDMPPIPKEVISDDQAWELYQYIIHILGCPPGEEQG
jgi:uncharacterized membrane protein